MSTAAVYDRLRVTDPGRWQAVARDWRHWAALAGDLVSGLTADLARLGRVWSGSAATAAAGALTWLRRRLVLFRVLCWQADQAASEFAASLERARRLLADARTAASRNGLTIDDLGTIRDGPADTHSAPPGPRTPPAPAGAGSVGGRPTAGVGGAAARFRAEPQADGASIVRWQAERSGEAEAVAAELAAAIAVAARADDVASARLAEITSVARARPGSAPPASAGPDCTAAPAAFARWWAGLDPAARWWLLAGDPGRVAALDGLPAADRDAANRLLLDERRADLERRLGAAGSHERDRLRELRRGLDALIDRLGDGEGARAYLLRLDLTEEGRTVLALGDPDRADNVLTHVPGMTADLESAGRELNRAAQVTERAGELGPAASTSAVLWLDYDAPDFLDEAAGAKRADAGAPVLHRFQEGLRASHEGPPARQTLLGHSYGSLVVGRAAATEGLAADAVVFVGSPGVGVDSVAGLAVPADRVWSSTSRNDVIQYAAIGPGALARDLAHSAVTPLADRLLGLVRPERELWFGHNPSDPAFGAHVFASAPTAGHLGYWDRDSPSLDTLAAITLGTAR